MSLKVLGIGDNVCDKYLHTAVIYPGGNALNIAVFARELGQESAYLGTFGDDEVAFHVHDTVQSMGLDLSHCRYCIGENGCARVHLVDGDRVFLPGNQGGISKQFPPVLSKLDLAYCESFDLLHTSVYSYMEEELPKLETVKGYLSMDFSDHFEDEYFRKTCPYLDVASISCGDMEREEVLQWMKNLLEFGCKHIVIATRGAKGAMVLVDGKLYEQSPCLIKAKDTMGAGDSFITAFLVTYLEGMKGDCSDFPASEHSVGLNKEEDYKNLLVQTSLYKAAKFSAEQCLRDGSFGYGKTVKLTEEDLQLIKK
mgnify:FL=1|nr:PfkB family carbohydrate kinase [uncultured Oribacterium sp.]